MVKTKINIFSDKNKKFMGEGFHNVLKRDIKDIEIKIINNEISEEGKKKILALKKNSLVMSKFLEKVQNYNLSTENYDKFRVIFRSQNSFFFYFQKPNFFKFYTNIDGFNLRFKVNHLFSDFDHFKILLNQKPKLENKNSFLNFYQTFLYSKYVDSKNHLFMFRIFNRRKLKFSENFFELKKIQNGIIFEKNDLSLNIYTKSLKNKNIDKLKKKNLTIKIKKKKSNFLLLSKIKINQNEKINYLFYGGYIGTKILENNKIFSNKINCGFSNYQSIHKYKGFLNFSKKNFNSNLIIENLSEINFYNKIQTVDFLPCLFNKFSLALDNKMDYFLNWSCGFSFKFQWNKIFKTIFAFNLINNDENKAFVMKTIWN